MPSITLQRQHTKTQQELIPLINQVREKLSQRYDIDSEWLDEHSVEFERIGLNGTLSIEQANTINIELDVGFVLAAFKGKIEQELNNTLDKALS